MFPLSYSHQSHKWPRICSLCRIHISLTNDHGYVPFVVFTSVWQMTTDMFPLSYSHQSDKWPRICSLCRIHISLTNDHGYVPFVVFTWVCQMTTNMFPLAYSHQFHKWPRICSLCRIHNLVLSSCMTYHQVCNKSNGKPSHGGNRCVTVVTNPVISHEWVKDPVVNTTKRTLPWSFVRQIFRNG